MGLALKKIYFSFRWLGWVLLIFLLVSFSSFLQYRARFKWLLQASLRLPLILCFLFLITARRFWSRVLSFDTSKLDHHCFNYDN